MPMVEYLNYEVVDDHGWNRDDEDLFEKAAEADLPEEDYGFFEVGEGEYILETAEAQGYEWPFSCRDGICSNCAAVLIDGEIEMDGNQALSPEEVEEKNIRLTCIGRPATDYIRLIYNAKHLGFLQDRIM
jgi:ferredoxin